MIVSAIRTGDGDENGWSSDGAIELMSVFDGGLVMSDSGLASTGSAYSSFPVIAAATRFARRAKLFRLCPKHKNRRETQRYGPVKPKHGFADHAASNTKTYPVLS